MSSIRGSTAICSPYRLHGFPALAGTLMTAPVRGDLLSCDLVSGYVVRDDVSTGPRRGARRCDGRRGGGLLVHEFAAAQGRGCSSDAEHRDGHREHDYQAMVKRLRDEAREERTPGQH